MSQEQAHALIGQGQELLKSGDRAAARQVLIQAVKANPNHSKTWIELSKVARDPSEEQRCQEGALKRDPSNALRQAMLALRGRPLLQSTTAVTANPTAATPAPLPAEPALPPGAAQQSGAADRVSAAGGDVAGRLRYRAITRTIT